MGKDFPVRKGQTPSAAQVFKIGRVYLGEARTDAEAEAPVLGHLIQRADSLEKTLMLGKTECKRRRGQQKMRWLGSFTDSVDVNLIRL